MSRTLKQDIPGPDWRVALETLEARGPGWLWGEGRGLPLVVDLGFGRGEFLMTLAEKQVGVAFLGVEVSHKRVVKLARRLARSGIQSVRLIEGRAQQVVALLPDACVQTFWVNFPDPWPKKRHRRRRLIQPAFVLDLARALEPGGKLQVATDDPDYAEWIDEVLAAAAPSLENRYGAEPWRRDVEDRPRTAYELEWRAEGRALHFFSYGRPAA